MELVTQSASK